MCLQERALFIHFLIPAQVVNRLSRVSGLALLNEKSQMNKVLKLVLLTGVLLIAPISSALAADVIDQQQDLAVIGTANSQCDSGGPMGPTNIVNGSTFTAGVTGSLTRIEVPVSSISITDPVWLRVYNTSGQVPTGDPIASQEVSSILVDTNASGGSLIVDFAKPTYVVAGTKYAFALGFDSCSTGQAKLEIQMGIPEGGDTLVQYQSSNSSWVNDGYYGINYTTYVETFPSFSPSPSPTATPLVPSNPDDTLADTGSNFDPTLWIIAGFIMLSAGFTFLTKAKRS